MPDTPTIRVKGTVPNRVGLWDRNPAHPANPGQAAGEVWVTGDQEFEVADTAEVRRALDEKRIKQVTPGQSQRQLPESRAPAETDKPGPGRVGR